VAQLLPTTALTFTLAGFAAALGGLLILCKSSDQCGNDGGDHEFLQTAGRTILLPDRCAYILEPAGHGWTGPEPIDNACSGI